VSKSARETNAHVTSVGLKSGELFPGSSPQCRFEGEAQSKLIGFEIVEGLLSDRSRVQKFLLELKFGIFILRLLIPSAMAKRWRL